jgi:beta-lactamase superfamily II metal-dependent hydrolase
MARYIDRHIVPLRTDETGAVSVAVEGGQITLATARARFPHYWQASLPARQ